MKILISCRSETYDFVQIVVVLCCETRLSLNNNQKIMNMMAICIVRLL